MNYGKLIQYNPSSIIGIHITCWYFLEPSISLIYALLFKWLLIIQFISIYYHTLSRCMQVYIKIWLPNLVLICIFLLPNKLFYFIRFLIEKDIYGHAWWRDLYVVGHLVLIKLLFFLSTWQPLIKLIQESELHHIIL